MATKNETNQNFKVAMMMQQQSVRGCACSYAKGDGQKLQTAEY